MGGRSTKPKACTRQRDDEQLLKTSESSGCHRCLLFPSILTCVLHKQSQHASAQPTKVACIFVQLTGSWLWQGSFEQILLQPSCCTFYTPSPVTFAHVSLYHFRGFRGFRASAVLRSAARFRVFARKFCASPWPTHTHTFTAQHNWGGTIHVCTGRRVDRCWAAKSMFFFTLDCKPHINVVEKYWKTRKKPEGRPTCD